MNDCTLPNIPIVAGDLGGTKTRLGLFEFEAGAPTLVEELVFPSAEFSGLSELLHTALRGLHVLGCQACFGVAGPVSGRTAQVTNLEWTVDAETLENRFGFASVRLINDLEATAWAIPGLPSEGLVTIKEGDANSTGNRAVIAAGTGLGQAGLVHDGTELIPFAGEGGHADFAPQSPLQWELREHLAKVFDHVSYERVVSGDGLVNIASFFFERAGLCFDDWVAASVSHDAAAAVSAAAGDHPACVDAMRLFVELFGAQAGNLALTICSTGGVYLAGGVAVRNRPWFEDGAFVRAFTAKGRMSWMVEKMPVYLILDEAAPLLGAARCAAGSPPRKGR